MCATELAPLFTVSFHPSFHSSFFEVARKCATIPFISKWRQYLWPEQPSSSLPDVYSWFSILNHYLHPIATVSRTARTTERRLITHPIKSLHRWSTGSSLIADQRHLIATEKHSMSLDISKAFDRVWNESLLTKLLHMRVPFTCSLLNNKFLHQTKWYILA